MNCERCKGNAEIVAIDLDNYERNLCNNCEFNMSSILNNVDNPNTIEDFWNGSGLQ